MSGISLRLECKGTGVPKWISIMTERSMCHLQKVCERDKSYSPYDVLESIKKEVRENWKMLSWTWCSVSRTSPCILLTNCTTPWKAMGLAIRSWSESRSPALKWTCWKSGLSEFKRKYGESLYYYIQQDTRVTIRKPCCTCVVGVSEAHRSSSIQEWYSYASS